MITASNMAQIFFFFFKFYNPAESHDRRTEAALWCQCTRSQQPHNASLSYIIRSAPAERNNSCWIELSSHTQRKLHLTKGGGGCIAAGIYTKSKDLLSENDYSRNSRAVQRVSYNHIMIINDIKTYCAAFMERSTGVIHSSILQMSKTETVFMPSSTHISPHMK